MLQDAGDNVTALVSTSGTVVERFMYDPYGAATVLDASWGARSGSAYDWTVLWQGQHWDNVSGLYMMRDGGYSPTLGRTVTAGTLGYWPDGDTHIGLELVSLNWIERRWDDSFGERVWNDTGMIATWFGRGFNPGSRNYGDPIPGKAVTQDNLAQQKQGRILTCNDFRDTEEKEWKQNAIASAPGIMLGSAGLMVMMVIPGPEQVVIAWAAARGLRATKSSGTWILKKLNGDKFTPAEEKALANEVKQLTSQSTGVAKQAVGVAREQKVAGIVGGKVSNEKITAKGIGSSDLDVLGPKGELIGVGGPHKASDLGKFGKQLQILQKVAAERGVAAKMYLEHGTPQAAIDLAKKKLGESNVIIFPK